MIGGYPIGTAPVGTLAVETESGPAPRPQIPAARAYRCFLGDLLLPIVSVQLRLRSASDSYISVVVPDAPSYADGISTRTADELVIEQGLMYVDGTELWEEFARGALFSIADQRGARNQSITLVAYGDNASTAPKEVEVENLQYVSTSDSTTLRVTPEPRLRPGDTAIVDGYAVTANLISLFIGLNSSGTPVENMEISD